MHVRMRRKRAASHPAGRLATGVAGQRHAAKLVPLPSPDHLAGQVVKILLPG